jgi:hypothetical protein
MSAAGPLASELDRAALAEVLASPEFQAQHWRGDALRAWLAESWRRLTELLGTSEAERWAGLGRAVFLGAVLAALLLLWRAVRQRQPGAVRAAPRLAPGPVTPRRLPAASIADAEQALAAGAAGEAVRLAFQAAVGALARRLGTAAAADTLTGAELAGRLEDRGFSRLAWLHERTVFGRRPATVEEAEAALAVAIRLVAWPAPGGGAGRPEVIP